MITKNYLNDMLLSAYNESIGVDRAWDSFVKFKEYISSGDKDTIKYFMDLVTKDYTDILKLRTSIAEIGYELTPSELSQYIFILTLSMLDSIEYH